MILHQKTLYRLICVGFLAGAFSASGQKTWQGAPGTTQSWHNAANWDFGVPGVFDVARVNNDGICLISATNAVAINVEIGNTTTGTATGEVRIVSRPLDVGFFVFAGLGNDGLTGGGIFRSTDATLNVGGFIAGQGFGAGRGIGEMRMSNTTARTGSLGVGSSSATMVGTTTASGLVSWTSAQSTITNAPNEALDVLVGTANTTTIAGQANANGAFDFSGVRMGPMRQISIGLAVCNVAQSTAHATGTVSITSALLYPASGPNRVVQVGLGQVTGDGATSIAEGELVCLSTTVQLVENTLVGVSSGSGASIQVASTGRLELTDSTFNTSNLLVGAVSDITNATGNVSAYGCLELTDTMMSVQNFMTVGTIFPTNAPAFGSPSGKVELVRSLIDIGGELTTGSNTVLRFHIDGPARGTQYGALDAGSATIKGDIEFVFSSPPVAGDIYRLIMVDATGTLECVESRIRIVGADPSTLLWAKGVNASGEHVLWTGIPNPPRFDAMHVESGTNLVLTLGGLVPDLDYRIQRRIDPAVEIWSEIANPVTVGSSHTTTTVVEQTPPVPTLRIFYP